MRVWFVELGRMAESPRRLSLAESAASLGRLGPYRPSAADDR